MARHHLRCERKSIKILSAAEKRYRLESSNMVVMDIPTILEEVPAVPKISPKESHYHKVVTTEKPDTKIDFFLFIA